MDGSNVLKKVLELIIKKGVFRSSLITAIAKLLVPTKESQFRFLMILIVDNWNDYVMNVEKFTINDDNLFFAKNVKFSP